MHGTSVGKFRSDCWGVHELFYTLQVLSPGTLKIRFLVPDARVVELQSGSG